MKPLILTLALAAGFLGGALSRFAWPQPAQAQAPAAPREVRAQSFVLESPNGKTLGAFSVEPRPGTPNRGLYGGIRLYDQRGREIWRTPSLGILPAHE